MACKAGWEIICWARHSQTPFLALPCIQASCMYRSQGDALFIASSKTGNRKEKLTIDSLSKLHFSLPGLFVTNSGDK